MAKIKIRRDSSTNWNNVNPTLDSGELALDTTNNKIKIGDGSNNWTSLAYLNPSVAWNNVTDKPADLSFSSYTDNKGEIRSIPINQKTTSYQLLASDHGKCVSTNSNITVPASVFSAGQVISIFNNSSSSITITTSAVTTYKAGTDTIVTSLTLSARGIANILFVTSSLVLASGNLT